MTFSLLARLGAACILLCCPLAARAQEACDSVTAVTADAAEPAPPRDSAMAAAASVVDAERLPPGDAIVLDGKLDDPAWRTAAVATHFTDSDPIDGAPASERTWVRVVYDDEALYVGARLRTVHTHVSARLGRRDSDLSDSDWFTVALDSYHDRQTSFRFKVNPAGVREDDANGDRSWDPVWDVATAVDDSGWTVEMRIPFSQLRFSPAARQVWGVQFTRDIAATAEHAMFAYTPKREQGGPSKYGSLVGLAHLAQGHRLELLPYVAARAVYQPVPLADNTAFANPFRDGHDYAHSAGADLELRPTSNFTVNATLNPDFGQIEADESQVNLSANETRFPEKRPFFIEGANIFHTAGSDLFYSRRIGRAPEGSVPGDARYADVPDAVPIVGAAKVTGRTESGWSIGVLEALTARTMAPWVDSARTFHASPVEPRTNYFVGRAKRDYRDGATTVGAIVTQVTRAMGGVGDSALTDRLRANATAGGVDFRTATMDRAWSLSGQLVGSTVGGTPAAMVATQTSPVHYFQRPDGHGVDSALTRMQGFRANLSLDKNAGLHWRGHAGVDVVSPGFETNDLAFQTGADRASVGGRVEYREDAPGRVWRNWRLRAQPSLSRDFEGDRVGTGLHMDAAGTLLDYWNGGVSWDHSWAHADDRLTRGGPLARDPGGNAVRLSLNSDARRPYTVNASASHGWTPAGGWSNSAGVRLGIKPTDFWSGDVEPSVSRSHGTAQYVGTVSDPFAVATYGARYLFAPIDQTTLSVIARLEVTMTPALTVSMVAQPFLASGAYAAPMALAAPGTYAFTRFGADARSTATRNADGSYTIDPDAAGPAPPFTVGDPSFNARTLNGTAALRWEWHPGSTAYLVWQHRRSAPGSYGNFDFARDDGALWAAAPRNTLLVKVSYWVNP